MDQDPLNFLPPELAQRLATMPRRSARQLFAQMPAPLTCGAGHQYEAEFVRYAVGGGRTAQGYLFPFTCPICDAEQRRQEQMAATIAARQATLVRQLVQWNTANRHNLDPRRTIANWATDYHGSTPADSRAGSKALLDLKQRFPGIVNTAGTGGALIWLHAPNNRGKTHLLHALGWALHEVRTVFYISAETLRQAYFADWKGTATSAATGASSPLSWPDLSARAEQTQVLLLDEVHSLAKGNGGDAHLFFALKAIVDANIRRGGSLVLATNIAPAAVLDAWHAAGDGSSERALASRLGRDGARDYDTYEIDLARLLPWRRPTPNLL